MASVTSSAARRAASVGRTFLLSSGTSTPTPRTRVSEAPTCGRKFRLRGERRIPIAEASQVLFEQSPTFIGQVHELTSSVHLVGHSFDQTSLDKDCLPSIAGRLRNVGGEAECRNRQSFAAVGQAIKREKHVPRRFSEQLLIEDPVAKAPCLVDAQRDFPQSRLSRCRGASVLLSAFQYCEIVWPQAQADVKVQVLGTWVGRDNFARPLDGFFA